MPNRMRVHGVDTITDARHQLAAALRQLADRLDGQEPDYSALHDAWEVLCLAGRARRKSTHSILQTGIPSGRRG
jgi:hypothetical protein